MNYLIILLVVTGVFLLYHVNWRPSRLVDIHYINLEKDSDRRAFMEKQLHARRWPAIDGTTLTTEDMTANHVGSPSFAIRHKSWDKVMRNTGVIGCWLSHKKLLAYLSTTKASEHDAHLIVEDDIFIPNDLITKHWPAIRQSLPRDWDMVYLGITNPVVEKQITPSLVKLKPGHGNWGTYAYVVRHGSLPTKILPCLDWFHDPIDNQFNNCFSVLNAYAVTPNIIHADSEFQERSSIEKAL